MCDIEKQQLELFNDTSSSLPAESAMQAATEPADYKSWLIEEGRKISAFWANRPGRTNRRVINWEKAVQMAFNFDLRIILDMKRIAVESRNTLSALVSKTSFKSASYADALKIVFSVYRQWRKRAVFNMDDIPAFVFIQE